MTAGKFITTEASVTPLGALSNGELVFLPQACQFAPYLAPATRGRLPFSFQAEKVAGIVLWAASYLQAARGSVQKLSHFL